MTSINTRWWLRRRILIDSEKHSRPFMGGMQLLLFVSLMPPAVGDVDTAIFHVIDQAVFLIDPAAVFPLQVAG